MTCSLLRAIVAAGALLLGMAPAALSAAETDCVIAKAQDFDSWHSECGAAIARETEPKSKAKLLYRRAYVSVEKYRYDDALKDLNDALTADPDHPLYLHERAYVYGELSEFAAALADLDRQVALQPAEPTAYRERAHARHFSGDFKGAYEDRDKEVQLNPESALALRMRGDEALWLGRFADAAADAKRAEKLSKSAQDGEEAEAAELLAIVEKWRKASSKQGAAARCTSEKGIDKKTPLTFIGDCTRAFLDAKTPYAQAEALTTRSIAWLVLASDQGSSTEDLRIAVALDPDNADRYVNLGYSYIMSRHSWAANREFERALKLELSPLGLAGRATARRNLGDKEGALADARASSELAPNEAAEALLKELEVTELAETEKK